MTDATNITPDTTTPAVVTYGGVQDRPGDVNHPDNLTPAPTSTDPAAGKHAAPSVPDDFQYDPATDTYTRVAAVTEHYDQ